MENQYFIDTLCYHQNFHSSLPDEAYKICTQCILKYNLKHSYKKYKKLSKIIPCNKTIPIETSYLKSLINFCDWCGENKITWFCNYPENIICKTLNVQRQLSNETITGLYETVTFHQEMETLKCIKMSHDAKLPLRLTEDSAGFDLSSVENKIIKAKDKDLVDIGIKISIPEGCYGRIAPRSGLAVKHFIDVGAGVIDRDYRGIIKVLLFNHGNVDFEIKNGDRVAQLIIEQICNAKVEEVTTLDSTSRNEHGFGSTGI